MSIYELMVKDAQGNEVSLETYRGKVLLIVNTATRCGLTPQYNELESLYQQYASQGLEILDFPCNQFRQQAPESSEEISQICQLKFGVQFKIFDKIDVNGAHESPLYTYLKQQQPSDQKTSFIKQLFIKLASLGQQRRPSDIQWNFTKFLVNRQGEVVARFAPTVRPKQLEGYIKSIL